ncbi:MAG: aldo/keto reductase [Oscillospiraceae bacterium]|nr:aldo/keto reductase [Oscillospiraceae bacterium]
MKTIKLKDGITIPRLGMGSWFIGDNPNTRKDEIDAFRYGIERGMTLIDTAEMYGGGRSESLIGEAIAPFDRESIYLISKVLPNNAGKRNINDSCERSLKRLNTDYLDCYLLHWRGGVPLEETIESMVRLVDSGKIKSFGVSNFDTDDMEELFTIDNGELSVMNQVLYHLGSRGVEYSLLPLMKQHNTAMMAYCPLAQGGSLRARLLTSEAVRFVAQQKNADPFQILLAFAIRDEAVIAIPKASSVAHVKSNFDAMNIELTKRDIELLSEDFMPPVDKMPLDMQ